MRNYRAVFQMKILLTGYNGFVGNHIMSCKTCEIMADEQGQIPLTDQVRMVHLISKIRPDAVIHLAAQSNVAESFSHPKQTYDTNFYGTLNLLEALRESKFKGKFLFVGSGDIYGIVTKLPITEDMPLKPRNPYAVSKVAAEALCYEWSQHSEFDIIMTRSFNHIGPGQSGKFAIASFAKQIMLIKNGKIAPVLKTGNLDVTRDFVDVRDVIRAYFLLLEHGENSQIYNICSGNERLIRDILIKMLEIANTTAIIEQESSLVRKVEQPRVYGSYAKLHQATTWRPEINFEQTLLDILRSVEI